MPRRGRWRAMPSSCARSIRPMAGWSMTPEEIWQATLSCCRVASEGCRAERHRRHRHHQPARDDGDLGPRDRHAAAQRHRLAGPPHGGALPRAEGSRDTRPMFPRRTGLLLDPYFSATKAEWLLDHIPGARARARARRTCVRHHRQLADLEADRRQGARHRCHQCLAHAVARSQDARTGTMDMLRLFGVPRAMLPEVRDSAGDFGVTIERLLRRGHSHLGVAGDQQAAVFGQACFAPGDVKSTYGTGCFALVNTGRVAPRLGQPAAGDRGLSRRRQDGICHRRQHLHRRRGGAMAARCAGRDPATSQRDRGAGAHGQEPPKGFISCRPSPDWARLIGIPMRAAPSWASRATWARRRSRAPRWTAVCFQTRDLLDAMARDMTHAGPRRAGAR